MNGFIRAAEEVDHEIPLHKDGTDDDSNLQPLCKECHEKKSITERGREQKQTIGADGWPVELEGEEK